MRSRRPKRSLVEATGHYSATGANLAALVLTDTHGSSLDANTAKTHVFNDLTPIDCLH